MKRISMGNDGAARAQRVLTMGATLGGVVSLSLGLGSCAVPSGLPLASSPQSAEAANLKDDLATPQTPTPFAGGQVLPITAVVDLGTEPIQLEVAQTRQQQSLGLMYRPELPDNRGMLFPFDPPRPVSFWMKNVPVALDMVFISDGRIVAIAAEVPPCVTEPCPTYGPGAQPVEYVIELRAGRAEELALAINDPVEIQWLEAEPGAVNGL